MARTYGRLHVHLVWTTKYREPTLRAEWRERLYSYIAGIAHRCGGQLLEAGAVADHVHLYMECSNMMSVSQLVNKIKANTARWIHQSFQDCESFRWQRGYGVFSVDSRDDAGLRRYVRNQEEHHRSLSFEKEYRRLLRAYGFRPEVEGRPSEGRRSEGRPDGAPLEMYGNP